MPEVLSSDTQAFFDVLNDESDHSAIIVGVAYLDACLGALLGKFLLISDVSSGLLDPRSGALGSFSARSDAAYSLGLVSKTLYQDLRLLAEIRNRCAHHHLVQSLSEPEIALVCSRLSFASSLLRWDAVDQSMFSPEQIVDPRTRFVMSCVMVSQRLLVDALSVQRREPRPQIKTTVDPGIT